MAVHRFSYDSYVSSPRISFSHDLCSSPEEDNTIKSYSPGSIDFDFCVAKRLEYEPSSSADELFCNGIIRPIQMKKKTEQCSVFDSKQNPKNTECLKKHETQNLKSFWGFKRSSSLNCGNGYARNLCSLPILSRSNSTGSSNSGSNAKRNLKQNSQKHVLVSYMKSSSQSSCSSNQKPPLKKNYGANGNSIRVSPVLNVGSASLFGFGSMFSNGKDKNRKK